MNHRTYHKVQHYAINDNYIHMHVKLLLCYIVANEYSYVAICVSIALQYKLMSVILTYSSD